MGVRALKQAAQAAVLAASVGRNNAAVADPDNRLDVPRVVVVVAELPTQAGDVPSDRIVGALQAASANRFSKLEVWHHGARVEHEGVKENVFLRAQSHLALALTNRPLKGVDSKIGQPKRPDRGPSPSSIRLRSYAARLGAFQKESHDTLVMTLRATRVHAYYPSRGRRLSA